MAGKAIIGLGNPGPGYATTRHNVGFRVLGRVATALGASFGQGDRIVERAEVHLGDGSALLLARPLNYMNRSGEVVAALARERGLGAGDILVVHDELDLPLGRLKLKQGGGTAGHRGLESIREHLGDPGFCRLRVGIGRPPEGVPVADFVLSPFAVDEEATVERVLDRAVVAARAWLEEDLAASMGRINRAPEPGGPEAISPPGGGSRGGPLPGPHRPST